MSRTRTEWMTAQLSRRPITLTCTEQFVYALCNDGTMWKKGHGTVEWVQVPNVPQPEK